MDLQHLRASDGTGEAVLAHVSSPRTIGSTVLELDNVDNWNTKCIVVTGTPAANGYIASAGMTIMYGHITAGDFIIDGYAPGYVDNGNNTTQIAIVKMTTNWADALVDILKVAHEDDGKLKAGAADRALNAPQGFLINGKIERTVASNNLTVAIKTLAGANPSASDPVYIRIGDTIRTLTSALSRTLNAGTNWFAAGSTSLANAESDYFVYLIWNTTDTAISLGIGHEPDMVTFADAHATTTNFGYLAYTGSAPASTDQMEVVGRFNATLSASASFNWSVPATSLIINQPVYETRVFSYTNPGDAGGTFYWQQVRGVKKVWGLTASISTSTGSTARNVNYPVGFFTAVSHVMGSIQQVTSIANQYYVGNANPTTTSHNFYIFCISGTGQARGSFEIIGS